MNLTFTNRIKSETKKLNLITKQTCLISILLFLTIFFAIGTTDIAFAEPVSKMDIIISDSVAPMKLEISNSELGSEIETVKKNVTLTNTGKAATEYICYIEQSGGKKDDKNNNSANFELSQSKIILLPGESKKLEIEIPVQTFKTNSKDADYKLKIIRNPNTQTPVGYIIPIKFTETDEKNSSGKANTGTGLKKNNSVKKIEIENKENDQIKYENSSKADTDTEIDKNEKIDTEKKSTNFDHKKTCVMLLLLVFLILFAAAIGIIIQKRRKDSKRI